MTYYITLSVWNRVLEILHSVKSNLIWRKYGPWWLYRAIAINPGASRHTKTWSSRLVGIYRKIPNGSHAQTEPDRTIFLKVSISLLDLWLCGSYFAVNSGTKRLKHTFLPPAQRRGQVVPFLLLLKTFSFFQSSSFFWLLHLCHHDIVTDSAWMSYFLTFCQNSHILGVLA